MEGPPKGIERGSQTHRVETTGSQSHALSKGDPRGQSMSEIQCCFPLTPSAPSSVNTTCENCVAHRKLEASAVLNGCHGMKETWRAAKPWNKGLQAYTCNTMACLEPLPRTTFCVAGAHKRPFCDCTLWPCSRELDAEATNQRDITRKPKP